MKTYTDQQQSNRFQHLNKKLCMLKNGLVSFGGDEGRLSNMYNIIFDR